MKGQYRILSEIILFAIGILITSYVIIGFNDINNAVSRISLHDQLDGVANTILHGIVHVVSHNQSVIRVAVPQTVSGVSYLISLDGNTLNLSTRDTSGVSVARQVFNINESYTIVTSSVISVTGFVDIIFSGTTVELRKSEKIKYIAQTVDG